MPCHHLVVCFCLLACLGVLSLRLLYVFLRGHWSTGVHCSKRQIDHSELVRVAGGLASSLTSCLISRLSVSSRGAERILSPPWDLVPVPPPSALTRLFLLALAFPRWSSHA